MLRCAQPAETSDFAGSGRVAISVALPTFAITVFDSIFTRSHQAIFVDMNFGPTWLRVGPYLLLPPFLALCYGMILCKTRPAWLSVVSGTAVSLLVITRFRGSYQWPGTFDLFDRSLLNTFTPILLALMLAPIFARLISKGNSKSLTFFALIVASSACALSIMDARSSIISSSYPYSRHIAVLLLGATALGATLYERIYSV